MKFGPNTAAIEEVITLFRNLEFLPSPKVASERYSIVRQFNQAVALAWETTYGPNDLTWSDIKAARMAEIWDVAYRLESFKGFDAVLSNEFDVMSRIIGERLTGDMSEVLDEVVADFQGCLYSRFAFGVHGSFFEHLFESYRAGAWPCGWTVDYPMGKMIIFAPSQ